MYPPGIQFESNWCHLPLPCLPPAGTRDPHLCRGYTKAKLLDPTEMVLSSCSSPSSFVVSTCLSHGFGAAKCIAGGCRHVVQAALPSVMALCLPALLGA